MTVRPEDHQISTRVANEAGTLLLALREKLSGEGVDSKTLKDEGDRQAHELIMKALREVVPADDAILSEEGADDLARLDVSRVWIVDPLDGTREFSEPPRSDWAVHIALTIDGVAVAGAVALPALGETMSTEPAPSAPPPMPATPRVVVSRTRPPAAAKILAEVLGADLVEMGSAGAKSMSVLRGESDVYAHSGGQYEWDSCAPAAVAAAAGMHVSRVDGSPMRYNNENPYLPDLLICRPELAEQALQVFRDNPPE